MNEQDEKDFEEWIEENYTKGIYPTYCLRMAKMAFLAGRPTLREKLKPIKGEPVIDKDWLESPDCEGDTNE